MYNRIIIFAGTTEGRLLAEEAAAHGIQTHVCVATEYGETLMHTAEHLSISHERMNEQEMLTMMRKMMPDIVVDATHPYAVEVTENIKHACEAGHFKYLRLQRETADVIQQENDGIKSIKLEGRRAEMINQKDRQAEDEMSDRQIVTVSTVAEAARFLQQTQGNILVTTGSKELKEFTALENFSSRVYARVLPIASVVSECSELGLEPSHLICMQGPFSKEMNQALIHSTNAAWLVTKESGRTGGFLEKCEAASACGISLLVIGRPMQQEGISLEECRGILFENTVEANRETHLENIVGVNLEKQLENSAGTNQEKDVVSKERRLDMVGIGIGTLQGMTMEAQELCRQADLIIGAKRMLSTVSQLAVSAQQYEAYQPEKILSYIEAHPQYERIVIALSGDAQFYSGAKRLGEQLQMKYHICSGISSLVYLCGKVDISWEDVTCITMHGREQNLTGHVLQHEKVFVLVGNTDGVAQQCSKLIRAGLGECKVYIGENLGYPDEQVLQGKASEFSDIRTNSLSVMLILNPSANKHIVTHGLPDQKFLRDKVPMTKEEIRSIILSKLQLTASAVVYDVGAGSGSVSVEMARMAVQGHIYAIERKPEAVDLMERNRAKFGIENMTIVHGLAPEALKELPAPTHVFIGGSAGNLKEIIAAVLQKNPAIRIVISAITLETMAEAVTCLKELPLEEVDIVTVSVGKSDSIGSYHLMRGQNPVTIVTCQGIEA